jgi:hypothetical protein
MTNKLLNTFDSRWKCDEFHLSSSCYFDHFPHILNVILIVPHSLNAILIVFPTSFESMKNLSTPAFVRR